MGVSLADAGARGSSEYVVKNVNATASGATAVWTPAAGKKWEICKFRLHVSSNASLGVAGTFTVSLLDGAGATGLSFSIFLPTTAGTTMAGFWDSGWIDLDLGLCGTVAAQALNVNLSAALVTGVCNVVVAGFEN